MVSSALEAATAPSKGGVVRESLVHSYPCLATLLEDFFKKLHYETNVNPPSFCSSGCRVQVTRERINALSSSRGWYFVPCSREQPPASTPYSSENPKLAKLTKG